MTEPTDYAEIAACLRDISRRLNQRRVVRPGTLRSATPLIGPALSWLRRLWNSVAGRWYVDPVVDGVNAFHEEVVRSLDDVAAILARLDQRLAAAERQNEGLPRQTAQAQADAAQARAQTAALHGQVAALQEHAAVLQQHATALQEQTASAMWQIAVLRQEVTELASLSQPNPAAGVPPLPNLALARSAWETEARSGLLRAQEAILTRGPDEDEESYRERFERDGACDAGRLEPYLSPDSRVLEIGCGIGRVLKHVQAQERWGLDISQGMLDWARVYLEGQEGIHLVQTNGFDFQGLPDDYFDLAYSYIVLQHINKQAGYSYMRETYRVLKPGGRFFFQLMNLLCDAGFQVFQDTLTQHYPLYLYTPDEVRCKLARCGFAIDELSTAGDSIYVAGHKPAAQPAEG